MLTFADIRPCRYIFIILVLRVCNTPLQLARSIPSVPCLVSIYHQLKQLHQTVQRVHDEPISDLAEREEQRSQAEVRVALYHSCHMCWPSTVRTTPSCQRESGVIETHAGCGKCEPAQRQLSSQWFSSEDVQQHRKTKLKYSDQETNPILSDVERMRRQEYHSVMDSNRVPRNLKRNPGVLEKALKTFTKCRVPPTYSFRLTRRHVVAAAIQPPRIPDVEANPPAIVWSTVLIV